LKKTLEETCNEIRVKWNKSGLIFNDRHFLTFCKASALITPLIPLPYLDKSWDAITAKLQNALRTANIDPDVLSDWARFAEIIEKYEPRFLHQINFPEKFIADMQVVIETIAAELASLSVESDYDELMSEAERLRELSHGTSILSNLFPSLADSFEKLSNDLEAESENLEEEANAVREDDGEEQYDGYEAGVSGEQFDIEALFRDL
jgi:hypothetical protein